MQAKEYLLQIKKLDRLIQNKLIEKEQWRAIAEGASSSLSSDKVQSSGNPQRMADAISNYLDIENEIKATIKTLVVTKKKILKTIEQLDTDEYDILHKIYLQGLSLYDVADIYDKSYNWATTTHGRALKHLQNILNAQEKQL
jgi:DNA-directed RNA polymerase specialized sigma24 family protein